MDVDIQELVARYARHLPEANDMTLIVLKGHLLIEEILERIIGSVVAHGELLDEVRLSFAQKAGLAQAMCWSKQDSEIWKIVSAINALRNELAHKLDSPKVDRKARTAVDLFLGSLENATSRALHERDPRVEQIKHSIAYCMGFLERFASDAKAYRAIMDRVQKAGQAFNKRLEEDNRGVGN